MDEAYGGCSFSSQCNGRDNIKVLRAFGVVNNEDVVGVFVFSMGEFAH